MKVPQIPQEKARQPHRSYQVPILDFCDNLIYNLVDSPQSTIHQIMLNINHNSVHQQLLRECRAQIAKGAYKAGERFASERELAQQFEVSRATANKVIAGLIAEGLLQHRKGIGTFVAQNHSLHSSLQGIEDFQNAADSLGYKSQTKVLEFTRLKSEQVPQIVADAMGLETKENVIYTRRVRLADEQAIIFEQRWIRASCVIGLKKNDLSGSFIQLLENQFETHVASDHNTVSAVSLNREQAAELGAKSGGAALCIEGTLWDENDNAICYYTAYYRGDRFYFENSVRPQRAATSSVLTML